ncbi:hypothetical protein CK203_058883 [Vitis vinifera]|uniref:Uncharacterized protein n=1 Tax=Vitis vinifera TaxID=29760 RepID=A0A438FS42_VITVI|nr:hypothetical protein CK203_058883 [Vitis vinifera]
MVNCSVFGCIFKKMVMENSLIWRYGAAWVVGGGAAANVGGVIFGGVDGLGAIVGVDGLERRWAVGVGRIYGWGGWRVSVNRESQRS